MQIETIVNKEFKSNTYVLNDLPRTNEVIIVDPGGDGNEVISYLKRNDAVPQYIILTHEHFDHITGTNILRDYYPAVQIVCSAICAKKIIDAKHNFSFYLGSPYVSVDADIIAETSSSTIYWSKDIVTCLPWEGHSPGGMLIVIDDIIFCGDQFIKDIKTVTNLPGGKKEKVKESLEFLRLNFPPETIIYPGHGDIILLKNLKIY